MSLNIYVHHWFSCFFDSAVQTSAADSARAYTTLIPTGHETTLTFTRKGALQYFSFLLLLSPNINHQLSSWATRGSWLQGRILSLTLPLFFITLFKQFPNTIENYHIYSPNLQSSKVSCKYHLKKQLYYTFVVLLYLLSINQWIDLLLLSLFLPYSWFLGEEKCCWCTTMTFSFCICPISVLYFFLCW